MQGPLTLFSNPTSSLQIIGRDAEVKRIKDFVQNYGSQRKKALLLYGPCGSGKTSVVHAIAKELNFELLEVNASDTRGKDAILEIVAPAVKQKSFFYDGKIILLDEIDGTSGTADRGGVGELVKIIEESTVPIILTANDTELDKLKPLLKISEALAYDKLANAFVEKILLRLCAQHGIEAEADAISAIARFSDGDVRAAINDLQVLSSNRPIKKEHIKLLSERARTDSIEQALTVVFKTMDASIARGAFETVDEDIDEQMLWLDYNVAHEYTNPMDLARAYGALSKADVYLSRIRRNQEWHLMVYAGALMTAGVALAKDAPYKNALTYKRTSRLLKIWQINMSNAKRKVIAHKISVATHCSNKAAFGQIDYYKVMCKDKSFATSLATALDLSEDELAWLTA
ncbi:MAG TPA: replication factor C large subunit [Acidobacteriota bacterium]|nr:replication factor C large subunit [Acidobacteriota bacterium]